ncbi:hypothetical protein [Aliivibrio sp.]
MYELKECELEEVNGGFDGLFPQIPTFPSPQPGFPFPHDLNDILN